MLATTIIMVDCNDQAAFADGKPTLKKQRTCNMPKKGLYSNIYAKKKRIAAGSGEKMRKPGSAGSPSAKAFKQAAKTTKAKKRKK